MYVYEYVHVLKLCIECLCVCVFKYVHMRRVCVLICKMSTIVHHLRKQPSRRYKTVANTIMTLVKDRECDPWHDSVGIFSHALVVANLHLFRIMSTGC